MKSKEYRIIGSEPVDDEELVNLCDRKNLRKSHYLSYVALLLLALSLAANVTFFIHRPVPNAHVSTPTRSTFGKSLLLRTALVEMHDQKPQSKHFSHINHCLDGLRQDIMCNADDTPRYSGMGQLRGTGVGQYRMCKDWTQLEQWANDHSACYQPDDQDGTETLASGVPLKHFKHCPNGTEPWKDQSGNA
ncbi:hypothetical protein Q9189_006252 [Teloschistes chrysophthalmus]